MIQELVGGSIVGITGGGILNSAPAHKSNVPPSVAAAATAGNLRCPRCDSTNTKFCYYNNYNLTQPRHFCKTCRRYWTKGGALRNVPIGGGCRRNKNAAAVSAAIGKPSSAGKMKTAAGSLEMGNYKNAIFNVFEQSPTIWDSSQYSYSHFLSSLRANQNPSTCGTGSVHSRILGLDHPGPTRLPTSCYPEYAPIIGPVNMVSASASASAILESAPVGNGELSFWNPALLWTTDLATTNGAFP